MTSDNKSIKLFCIKLKSSKKKRLVTLIKIIYIIFIIPYRIDKFIIVL